MDSTAKVGVHRTFSVGAVGLSRIERQMLERVLGITAHRNRNYRLVNGAVRGVPQPDIVMVNVSNSEAVSWLRLHYSRRRPFVMLCPKHGDALEPTPLYASDYQLALPLNPNKILKTLDEFTIKELDYIPEMQIGSDCMIEETSAAGIHMNNSLKRSLLEDAQRTVLVIDDSLAVRKQIGMGLGLHQARPVFAESGEAALELLAKQRFDLIFLDVVMPGINGYTVCKEVKKNRLNERTPVVMLTSKSSPFDKVKGTLAGCDSYLTKPIDLQAFNAVARRYLQTEQQERAT